MDTPFIVAYLLSFAGLSGAIYGLFAKAGETVKDDSKKAVSKWLQNIELEKDAPNWPATFASLFDRVFTERHFSWKCFRRSSIASMSAVIFMILIFIVVNQGLVGTYVVEAKQSFKLDLTSFIGLFLFTIILNIFPDYISLLVSRYILKKMCDTQSGFRWCVLLIIDFFITPAIFILFLHGVFLFSDLFSSNPPASGLGETMLKVLKGLDLSSKRGMLGIYLYTTFFTSVWIWFYAGSGFLIKLIVRGGIFLSFFRKHLNIEEQPFRSMGFVLIILISFAYLIGGCIMLIT